ncbi:MFS transporter [Crassaminicella profunda]|uniref:MFS transporter n=1 Tax=Crassaminicella profunda TaxID=1286698 RepID=UPI001CA6F305|nr:MFS transporter [Crassaminicella profunda]QZY56346.1 MFS transporter [Crassaminicella profunda]
MKNNTLKMMALSFVPFIMVLGNSMLIPVFTDIKRELHISQYEVSLLISYFSFPAALLIPFLGFLSDRIGRKKVLVPALIIYGLGGVISGFSSILYKDPYKYILIGRVIQGFGAAGTSPIAMALVSDMFSSGNRSRALGIIEASNGVGKILSPILGSIIALIAWYMIFFSYSILTIPVALLIWFFIDEDSRIPERKDLKKYFQEIMMITKNKRLSILLCFVIGFIALFILYGLLANLSDIIGKKQDNNSLGRGFVVALPLFSMAIVSYWFGAYLKIRRDFYKIFMMISLIVCTLAVSLIPYLEEYIHRLFLLEVIATGVGIILTILNTFVTSCVPKGKRGVITAFYNSFRFLGISFGPIFFTQFHKGTTKILFIPFLTTIIVILVILYVKSEKMFEYFGMKKDMH